MDRVQDKIKKGKPSFKGDLKNLKENLKIREILRTVKMNSSMRLKAPPGSKIMDTKDFIDNETILEDSTVKCNQEQSELCVPSAINQNVVFDKNKLESDKNLTDATNKCIYIDRGTCQSSETSSNTSMLLDSQNESLLNSKQQQFETRDNATGTPDERNVTSMESPTLVLSLQQPKIQSDSTFKVDSEVIKQKSEEQSFEVNFEKENENMSGVEPIAIFEDNSENHLKEVFEKQSDVKVQINLKEQYDQKPLDNPQEHSKNQSKYYPADLSEKQLKKQEFSSHELSIEHNSQRSKELLLYCSPYKDEIKEQYEENTQDQDIDQNEQQQASAVLREILDESQSHDHCVVELNDILDNSSKLSCEKQLEEKQYKQLSKPQLPEEQTRQQLPVLLVESSNNITDENFDTTSKLLSENHTMTDPPENVLQSKSLNEIPMKLHRNRKLSWDPTMLSRREGLSQSEIDLHSIGKLPLERKSSFFRKKMDSFLRNTTELFRKQSFNAKSESVQRRGSMSISLQSLNEASGDFISDYNESSILHTQKEEIPGSMSSSVSSSTLGRSNSTLSGCHSEAPNQGSERSLVGSQPILCVTHALGDYPSNSVHSLNESYLHDSLLQNRAISMSSGLDCQSRLRRKKSTSTSNRSNRVTWLASEGLTNYFRRMIQDENNTNIQEGQTYQDYSSTFENKSEKSYGKNDTKGRRWSYQRAVSGEDPTLHSRYQDSSLRRRKPLTEYSEDNPDISRQLSEYQRSGVPKLRGFEPTTFTEEIQSTLDWAQNKKNIDEFVMKYTSAKQAVLCELISTEGDYLQHLHLLVEVFIAAAHALQDNGQMLDVATEKLFLNIPDIYNANRSFWQMSFYPMIQDALTNGTPFDPKLMFPGFRAISDIFEPYEKYAMYHPRANDYLRSLTYNSDFATYLSWCHSQKVCQRLQITDLLVKPIQRITKYSLILKRISQLTEDETEKDMILQMDQCARTYVSELNRSVKQRQEIEKAEVCFSTVENYEVETLQANFQEFKDEDVDEYTYHTITQSNLRAPMLNCHAQHARTVIHEGDLRFKDGNKEIEVRAILFTDLLIICKKQSKGSPYPYKMIRPKYMIDKLVDFPKYGVRNNVMELILIFVVMVDDLGSGQTCFTLTESSKDPNGSDTLKLWEQKIKEAQYTYNLAVWLYYNPSYHISELEQELASDYSSYGAKQKQISQEEYNIEREAKERVVTMMHRTFAWSPSFSTDHSHASSDIVSMSITERESTSTNRRVPGIDVLQNRWKRPATGYSSRNSRISSFQQSTSATSHDEYESSCNRQIHRAGSSIENTQPTINEDNGSSSVTVKVMRGENESECSSTTNPTSARSRYSARSPGSQNTLKVQNTVVALVHSLPDLSLATFPHRERQSRRSPSPISASDRLYQSHQEQLKNRLNINTQYLAPDNRGSSYPPTSPGRASLKRGLAFSYSFSRPPLTRMGHVTSQGALDLIEPAPTPSPSPIKNEKSRFVAKFLTPGSETNKDDRDKEKEITKEKDKKSKLRRKKKNIKDCKRQERVEEPLE